MSPAVTWRGKECSLPVIKGARLDLRSSRRLLVPTTGGQLARTGATARFFPL